MNPNSFALCNTCQNRIPLQRLPIPPHLHMSLLGHIVERCGGSYTQPELHRGVKGKNQLPETSCFYRPQLIFYEQGQRRITRKRTLPWCRRLGLNQRIPPGAVLCLLSYVCIPPSFRRGQEERKDGKNEDTDITPHPHSDTYFSMLAPNQGQRPIFFAIL